MTKKSVFYGFWWIFPFFLGFEKAIKKPANQRLAGLVTDFKSFWFLPLVVLPGLEPGLF